MNIRISPRRAGRLLCFVVASLAAASVAGQVARYTINHGAYKWYTGLFDVDREQNIPSWWQGTCILICAVLLSVIALHKRRVRDRFRWSWTGLAAIFFVLAIDEMCSLHEQLGKLLSSRGVQLHGAFEYQWVVPGMAIVLVVGLMYVRFLLNLPRRYGARFAIAGAIYVCGAIGVEMISAWYAARFGDNNLPFQLIATLEEIMEMSGMSLFLVTLVSYASQIVPPVTVHFDSETEPQRSGDGVVEVEAQRRQRDRFAA